MKTVLTLIFVAFACFRVQSQQALRTETIHLELGKAGASMSLETLGLVRVPKQHALIVAVSEYVNSGAKLSDLEKPIQDAERLYRVLTTRYHFDSTNVRFLKNPTFEQLSDELVNTGDRIGDGESLLVFYAGHGFYDKSKELGYWLPSDAKIESRARWISNTTVRDYIGSIKQAKHIILITDACFGGSIFTGGGRSAYEANLQRQFMDAYKYKSRKGLTSGNLTEVPDQSLFIEMLLRELEKNTDPFITALTLFTRVYEPIVNNSPTRPQFGVVQGMGDEGGGDFVLFRK